MQIERAVKLAIGNVLKEGLTDIFPVPWEISLLKSDKFQEKVAQQVKTSINGKSLDTLNILPLSHVLLPKGGPFDFRRCALIDPTDTVKFTTLVLLMAEEIEKKRPTKNREIIYSYRLKPKNGYLFDSNYNITRFKRDASKKQKNKRVKFVVTCDIANFYDRLNLHRLESVLLSLNIDRSLVKLLNELLLFWSNRDSYGLPVGSNASRILAEAALIEVDNYLISKKIKFSRFVDDYRMYAPDANSAHYWLTQLIERLWLEGLTINKTKTKIEEVDIPPQITIDTGITEHEASRTPARQKEEEVEVKSQFRIIAGYGGVIPTLFRAPKEKELEKFSSVTPEDKEDEINKKKLPQPEEIIEYVKVILANKRFSEFVKLPNIAERYPQFTPYIVDTLIKHSSYISDTEKKQISKSFSSKLNLGHDYLPEYLAVSIVRILGSSGFEDKDQLLAYFRSLKRNAGSYIGRALLEAIEPFMTRGEVLEVRGYFQRADSWEKRQIARIVSKHLNDDEARPWLKNIRTQESRDLFLSEFVRPAK